MKIDITMTAVRRPELLEQTLASFSFNLFSHFQIENVYVNVDPFLGSTDDEAACRRILETYFSAPKIRIPETPSFGAAVKWLWAQASRNTVFHMEDDWLCLGPIYPADIEPRLSSKYSAVAPLVKEHHWKRLYPHLTHKTEWFSVFGRNFYRRVPSLGTGPKFIDPEYARSVSELLIPELDPEKQQLGEYNPPLARLISKRKCYVLTRGVRTPLLRDIGRDWSARNGIVKEVTNGSSTWQITHRG